MIFIAGFGVTFISITHSSLIIWGWTVPLTYSGSGCHTFSGFLCVKYFSFFSYLRIITDPDHLKPLEEKSFVSCPFPDGLGTSDSMTLATLTIHHYAIIGRRHAIHRVCENMHFDDDYIFRLRTSNSSTRNVLAKFINLHWQGLVGVADSLLGLA